ncbi:MAG: transketolase C-terminal domain-containing protein [Eggerthella lenta]
MIREGDDVAILAFGRMVSRAKEAAALLAVRGIDARVVDMRWVKPLDVDEIARAAQTKLVVTVEGGIISGGVGEGVLNELARQGAAVPELTLGIPDTFVPQGSSNQLLHDLGLDAEGIADAVNSDLAEAVLDLPAPPAPREMLFTFSRMLSGVRRAILPKLDLFVAQS